MKNLFWLAGFFLFVLGGMPHLAQAQWRQVALDGCADESNQLNDVYVGTGGVVYVVGGGAIVGGPGIICKSTDHGTTWSRLYTAVPEGLLNYELYAIDCDSNNICFVAGANGVVLVTTDGGVDWTRHNLVDDRGLILGPPNEPTFWDVDVVRRAVPGSRAGQLEAYVVGGLGAVFRFSSAEGTWNIWDLDVTNQLEAVAFESGSVGYLGGYDETLFQTENGGFNWEGIDPPPRFNPAIPYGIDDIVTLPGTEHLWILADIAVYHSADSGASWEPGVLIAPGGGLGANIPFSDCFFETESIGWCVGGAGGAIIAKTEDGGATWVHSISSGRPEDVAAYDLDGGNLSLANNLRAIDFSFDRALGFIVGRNGTLLRFGGGDEEAAVPRVPVAEGPLPDLVPMDGWSMACSNVDRTLTVNAGAYNRGEADVGADDSPEPFQVLWEVLFAPVEGEGEAFESNVCFSQSFEISTPIPAGGFLTLDNSTAEGMTPQGLYQLLSDYGCLLEVEQVSGGEASVFQEVLMRITLDSEGEIAESNEDNNVSSMQRTSCGAVVHTEGEAVRPREEAPAPSPPVREERRRLEKDKKVPAPKKLFEKKPQPKRWK